MGLDVTNCTLRIHIEEGSSVVNVIPNEHKGNANIDETGPDVGASGLADLINATTSRTAFDSAALTAFGSWYSARPEAWKAGTYTALRQVRLAL